MFRNYLITSFRSLLKNVNYSLINIGGLTLGITCVFLIVQYLRTELAYDRFHDGAENIYRITWENQNPQTRVPHPMAQAMANDFPEVESAVSLTPLWGPGLTRQTFSFRNIEKNIQYDETNVLAVDSNFFKVFSFELLKGDPSTVLKRPDGLLISESTAKRYFGTDEPIGKFLSVNDDRNTIEVIGVFRDVPAQSHFHFDFLVSYVHEKADEDPDSEFYTWKDFGHYNYIRLKPGTDAKALEAKILPWVRKYIDLTPEEFRYLEANHYGFRLQPITDIHLTSVLRWELEPNGNIDYVYMMSAAAILILVIACINFINLSTAQSSGRAKEIGIRKSLGAFRTQLITQFTGESMLVALLATFLSLVLIQFALPLFNAATHQTVQLSGYAVVLLVGLGLTAGLLAGLYPSLFLSGIKPAAVLKGKGLQGPRGTGLRKVFTVFQFSASMILICVSVIIYQQLNAVENRGLGFNREEVLVIPIKNRHAIAPHQDELHTELAKIAGVKEVSAASNIPGKSFNQQTIFADSDPQQRVDASEIAVSYDLLKVLDIPLASGRNFLRENAADENSFLINETAAQSLNLNQPVGKTIVLDRDGDALKGNVIGVVKDFHYQSFHQAVQPLIFTVRKANFNYVLVKLNTKDFPKTLAAITSTWKKFDSRFGFEFSFLSDTLNEQYAEEKKIAQVLITFSVVAILIACFGLLGIAALTFQNRTKEVSVRKVLGAGFGDLIFLLVKDFTTLVLFAVVIAAPLAWWIMNDWLQHFTYRVGMSPLVFVGAGVLLLVVAWATLGYLTLKLARVNPATTLKSE
ncbi:ABC transporter permease [Chryseolinea lacunae]|uniref:ABC transporter permease n=1 Tax=Chryseolinea lacunae TaxID=2801331 RepID=A0ABS1L2A3_9BACT|nr:ABC transporter permease [Chryseolinea lacunae]MBL0745072.1 ABC transporter permease [Chryseolinea lacunae]